MYARRFANAFKFISSSFPALPQHPHLWYCVCLETLSGVRLPEERPHNSCALVGPSPATLLRLGFKSWIRSVFGFCLPTRVTNVKGENPKNWKREILKLENGKAEKRKNRNTEKRKCETRFFRRFRHSWQHGNPVCPISLSRFSRSSSFAMMSAFSSVADLPTSWIQNWGFRHFPPRPGSQLEKWGSCESCISSHFLPFPFLPSFVFHFPQHGNSHYLICGFQNSPSSSVRVSPPFVAQLPIPFIRNVPHPVRYRS